VVGDDDLTRLPDVVAAYVRRSGRGLACPGACDGIAVAASDGHTSPRAAHRVVFGWAADVSGREIQLASHVDTERERRLVLREFLASALYLAVVLLAVLVAAPDDRLPSGGPLVGLLVGLLVGTAIGLTLAHWFAFRLAADLTALDETDLWAAGKEALHRSRAGRGSS
jgi:hypothetical protein